MAIRDDPFELRRQVERLLDEPENIQSPPPLTPTEQTLMALLDKMAEMSEQTTEMVLFQEEILNSLAAVLSNPPEVNVESPSAREIGQAVASNIEIPKPLTAGELAAVIKSSIPDYGILKDMIQRYETSQKEVINRLKKLPSIIGTPVVVDKLTTNSDISDRSARELGHVTVKNPTINPETGLAKDTTLASVLTELQRRPTHKVATDLISVASGGAYVTVASVTPTVAVVVQGYNADFQAITSAAYRLRLILGTDASPDVQHAEEVNTTANSWQPLKLNVAANTRIAVQVVHDQVTSQNVRGTINYYEEP